MTEGGAAKGIEIRYHDILDQIRIATRKSGRNPDSIRLVVVTKGHSLESVREVIAAGAQDLGENYVQEAVAKIDLLDLLPRPNWHMIGHVQTRKAGLVVRHFSWVHSIDSLKLARRLSRFAEEYSVRLKVLLEYNLSGEGSKFGWDAADPAAWPNLEREAEEILEMKSLDVQGVMTMAPYATDPERSRPFFHLLRSLKDQFSRNLGADHFTELSMGMSQDFEVAIEEGATMLRIGEAIMGPRPPAG